MDKSVLEYYSTHGIMSDPGSHRDFFGEIPRDINGIVKMVQSMLIHQAWANRYGVEVNDSRKKETVIRPIEKKLDYLRKKGLYEINDIRDDGQKFFSICRDFSLFTVALCREVSIPARARCGFATYFEKDKYIDHWVVEYWSPDREEWIMVDPQLDSYQQQVLGIDFDPLDVCADRFILASDAWRICREGKADPNLFGIFEWWGYTYLKCNLILDINSLARLPMQPWDSWQGYKGMDIDSFDEEDYRALDELALRVKTIDKDLRGLISYIENNRNVYPDLSYIY